MGGQIIVIGAGAAGLSAALSLADKNIKVLLVSDQPSERAQSILCRSMRKKRFRQEEILPTGRRWRV